MNHPVGLHAGGFSGQGRYLAFAGIEHFAVSVALVQGGEYVGFAFGIADARTQTDVFLVEVEPGFMGLEAATVEQHAAGTVDAVAHTTGIAVAVVSAFAPVGDGEGSIVLLGGDAGVLAVVELAEEVAVVFASGDEEVVDTVRGVVVEVAVTVAGFVAHGAGRRHARTGHVSGATVNHVVEPPEHAVAFQRVFACDAAQGLFGLWLHVGGAQAADAFGQLSDCFGVLVGVDVASGVVGVVLPVVEDPLDAFDEEFFQQFEAGTLVACALAEFQVVEDGVDEFFSVAGEVELASAAAVLGKEVVGLDAFDGLYGKQSGHALLEVAHLYVVARQYAGGKRTHDDVGAVGSGHEPGSGVLVAPAQVGHALVEQRFVLLDFAAHEDDAGREFLRIRNVAVPPVLCLMVGVDPEVERLQVAVLQLRLVVAGAFGVLIGACQGDEALYVLAWRAVGGVVVDAFESSLGRHDLQQFVNGCLRRAFVEVSLVHALIDDLEVCVLRYGVETGCAQQDDEQKQAECLEFHVRYDFIGLMVFSPRTSGCL